MTGQSQTQKTHTSLSPETIAWLDELDVSWQDLPNGRYSLGDQQAGPYYGEYTADAIETATQAAIAAQDAGKDPEWQFEVFHDWLRTD